MKHICTRKALNPKSPRNSCELLLSQIKTEKKQNRDSTPEHSLNYGSITL